MSNTKFIVTFTRYPDYPSDAESGRCGTEVSDLLPTREAANEHMSTMQYNLVMKMIRKTSRNEWPQYWKEKDILNEEAIARDHLVLLEKMNRGWNMPLLFEFKVHEIQS